MCGASIIWGRAAEQCQWRLPVGALPVRRRRCRVLRQRDTGSTLVPVRLGPALPTAQLHLSCAAMTGKSGRLNPPQGNRAPSIAPSLPTAADGMSDPSQAPASAAAATPPAPSPTATGAPPNPPAAARHRKSLSHSSSLRLIAGLLSAARTAVCVCQSQCVCVRVRCVPIKLD